MNEPGLTAKGDPVLAKLWENDDDSVYDNLNPDRIQKNGNSHGKRSEAKKPPLT